ncbi:MAG: NAD(P)H-dependent oxidoreductase [Deltaproteobacteria bacterium]|nr:NAD(P)H-dependent oxidoreductase [Deltaproteobacteria bacterium]
MQSVRIVGLAGAKDGGKSTRTALDLVLAAARAAGAETEVFDLATLDIPMYEHGMPPTPDVLRWVEAARSAHGMVWITPLYHGSVSGLFKNAIDWLELLRTAPSAYLTDKVVALGCCAGGVQAMQGINAMEPMVRSLRGLTLPLVAPVERAWQAFDAQGQPVEPAVRNTLELQGKELVRVLQRLHGAV